MDFTVLPTECRKHCNLAAAEGISIASLEKKLNIGNGTIRKWNEASPTFENVFKVAKYFNVSMDYFAEWEEK